MSRTKGTRLWLRPERPDRPDRKGERAVWIIRDGNRGYSTGCHAGDIAGAEEALRAYLAKKHDPAKSRGGNPLVARLPDVINLYAKEVATRHARPAETARRLAMIAGHFGDVPLSIIDRSACLAYAKSRGKPQAARRELEDLRAAIGHWLGDGLIAARVNIELPAKAQARETWHTRSEIAKLIRTAWRKSQPTPNGGKRYVARHIARFILVGVYTGTRAAAICEAALGPAVGRGYVDLDQGVFYRRAPGTVETTKRRPPARLHPRLLAHMRRWKANGICRSAVVEWLGEPVQRVSKGYRAVSEAAGIWSSPHCLRHTAVTWAMQGGASMYDAAEYFGMRTEMIQKNYGHHHPDQHAGVVAAIGGGR